MLEFALGAFLTAFLLAAVLTPLARRLALATNLVAEVRPDRLHREPRPYGGGLALLASITIGLVPAVLWVEGWADVPLVADVPGLRRLAIGAVLFFIIGLIDDRYALPALPKLFLQFAAATVAVMGLGLKATVWLTVPHAGEVVSILWIVAVVNAYNLLDHADGLAAAVGFVAMAALGLGQMVVAHGFPEPGPVVTVPVPALAVAGALLGFLVYNFPPAKLFMGDAGSALIGYLLAALTMDARYYFEGITPSRWVVLAPLAILAVPLFDMVCVVFGRLARGRNPMVGDATSHLAHRMLARGVGPRTIVLFAAAMATLTGAAAVMMYHLRWPALLAAWGIVAAALGMMLIARRRPRTEASP